MYVRIYLSLLHNYNGCEIFSHSRPRGLATPYASRWPPWSIVGCPAWPSSGIYLAADCQLSSEEGRHQLRFADLRTCVIRRKYSNFGDRCFAAKDPKLPAFQLVLGKPISAKLIPYTNSSNGGMGVEIAVHCDYLRHSQFSYLLTYLQREDLCPWSITITVLLKCEVNHTCNDGDASRVT